MTDPIELPRDHEGKVDVDATMQKITSMLEDWIREYPEQWPRWLHRRWREDEERRPVSVRSSPASTS
jgi:KDO2-lipid IV(A) lauroyltransferase